MPKDIDEDLIEATIRRVAESKAARSDLPITPAPEDSDPIPDVLRGHEAELPSAAASAGPDEDIIEATIRRVAEAKAARDVIGDAPLPSAAHDGVESEAKSEDSEDGQESLEKLRFDDHGRSGPRRFSAAATGGVVKSPWAQFRPTDDEEDVEPSAAPEPVETPDPVASGGQIEPPSPEPEAPAEIVHETVAAPRTPIVRAVPAPAMRRTPSADEVQAAPDTGSIAEISAKLDTVIALLERLTADAARPSAGDWAGAGRVVTLGAPPRSGFRDPRAATAEQLTPDQIDTRPLPPPPPPLHVEPKRGLELLPRTYRITVEDKRRGVDLVPLHRALLGMDAVKDMSLLSYNNGVAIVALETSGDLEPDALRAAVSQAMTRDAKVEVHNENTMVVKLAED